MKKAIYDKFEDIPQIDRDENNYQLATDGSNAGKYVLIIDGVHPVMVKNTQLVAQNSQREIEKQQAIATAVAGKDLEITRLNTELQTVKTQSGLPAGQVAVTVEDHQLLQQLKTLGEFNDVKAKVDEHAVLKARDEANNRKTLLTEAAKAHGFNPEAFVSLAELKNLAPNLEMREVPDPKKPEEKVKHYFVKSKDAAGAETTTVLSDYVKNSDDFKPFLPSLTSVADKQTPRTPNQGHGNEPKEGSAAKSYIKRTYQSKPKADAE